MTSISLLVVIVPLVALLVVGTEDMGSRAVFANRDSSGHAAFTNKGINVQKDTDQDQGCEAAGGMSGTTNACTATSGSGSTQTSVSLTFDICSFPGGANSGPFTCNSPGAPNFCNNIGCTSISCGGPFIGVSNCTTDNGVQLTSCSGGNFLTCTRTEPGTGITNSGGVSGDGG
jgi:hypothetical protein